jgi:filamentous hemagglutinin
LVGAATAELGGGDAAQGALGAAASEKASGAMVNYLADHDIDPNSAQGKTLMQLASAAMGGVVGGGAGAVTALDGEKYNRQLHVKETDWIKENAAAYAKTHPGMSVAQAEKALGQQAYRQVQSGVGGAWDADASAFLATAGRELWTEQSMPGETFLMFQATSFDQRKDTTIFANAQQADIDFYIRNGLQPVTPDQAQAWEQMRISATKKAATQAGIIMVSSVASPAVSTYVGAAGAGSLATFLAGRGGGALIGGVSNAASQYVQEDEVKLIPVGISVATGALGAGKGFVFNVGLNAAGGAGNVWLDNTFYGTNKSIWDGAMNSGVDAAVGYGMGYLAASSSNQIAIMRAGKLNLPEWQLVGPGMYAPTGPQPASYILSNIASSITDESWREMYRYIIKSMNENNPKNKKDSQGKD